MTDPKALPLVANLADMPWEDSGSDGKYGCHDKIVADHVRQERLDMAVTKLAPGKASCPYHFHHVGEELFVVLEGRAALRIGGETRHVGPQDVVSCPPGPAGAHQFFNDGDADFVYLAISINDPTEICEYPDSKKLMAHHRAHGATDFRHIGRLADAVPYMDGETT